MKNIVATLVLVLGAVSVSASSKADGEARLLRFPATNGSEITFSYAGDLYSVSIDGGQATRLTSHKGYEMFARYSPDGKSIAFTAEYDGNREVYLMPAAGGAPVRLTYTSTNSRDELGDRMGPNNIVMTWTPDGKSIIFRNRIESGFRGKLWSVSTDGAMPVCLPLPEGGFCSYSPDGKRLAYNRVMREFRTWKYYRGGMADDVWIYDGKSVRNITANDAQDIFPMWCGNRIFFASDRDMTMNIFFYDTASGKTTKVTDFRDYDVKFPSSNGSLIVFEQAGYIWKLDPSTLRYEKVSIRLNSDEVYARSELKDVHDKVSYASLSADGRRLAVTARGEVFDVPSKEGVTRNLSHTPGAQERCGSWSPDGKSIAWISDLSGETEIWLRNVEDEAEAPVQLTSGNDTYIRQMKWSPDGKRIVYTDRKNRMVEVNPVNGQKRVIAEEPRSEFRHFEFSSDGKWITYCRPSSNKMSVVYVRNLETGKEYPVTEQWYDSSDPAFSKDGKYLIFNSYRNFNPIYSSVEWNFAYDYTGAVYMAMLGADTPSPLLPSDGERTDAQDGKGADSLSTVRVDPEGIFGRIVKLPITGRSFGFYSDGKKLWYTDGDASYVLDFATQKSDKCADGVFDYQFGAKKGLLWNKGGALSVVDFPAEKISPKENVNLRDMVATVDYQKEWPLLFDQIWRAFRDGFYLENMHGVDWKEVGKKYAVLVPYAKTRLDLNYILGEMVSELACGHAYVNVGEYDRPERIDMGLLGAELKKDRSGYFRIERILRGAPYSESLRSPLGEPGMNVSEGEFITSVNGISTAGCANIYSMMVGKAGKLVEITVNSKAEKGGRKIVVRPCSDEYPLYHFAWVQKNIETVNRLSKGKVGYIFIPDMGPDGLKEFARYYYPQLDKEALIIDDRSNGGGNVSPMIIERLLRNVYRMTMYRTSSFTGTIPEGTHTGPKVLLIDKYSASDGDLFPWSFKANRIGTVIGTRTWGGIIGISSSLPYMDGTDVRVPFFTNYDASTGKWIVENHGVDPDIVQDNDPVKEATGIDEQLEKAVEVAMEQIKQRKALPAVPKPRTFRDLGLPE